MRVLAHARTFLLHQPGRTQTHTCACQLWPLRPTSRTALWSADHQQDTQTGGRRPFFLPFRLSPKIGAENWRGKKKRVRVMGSWNVFVSTGGMNVVKELQRINQVELDKGYSDKASW
jgi:hypothetical protein